MKKSVFVLVISVILISVIVGAAFQMCAVPSEEVRTYLNEFLWNIKSDSHNSNIFHNSVKEWYMTLAALIICGFIKPGVIPSIIITARKSFVTAFSVSAFIHYYKVDGFFSASALSLPFMISLPALTLMCCASVSLSFNPDRLSRNTLRDYIIISIAAAIMFLAAALAEGYLVPSLLLFITN